LNTEIITSSDFIGYYDKKDDVHNSLCIKRLTPSLLAAAIVVAAHLLSLAAAAAAA
jgi:hypothetical protein